MGTCSKERIDMRKGKGKGALLSVAQKADRSQRLLQVGRHQEAIQLAEQALAVEPAHVGALEPLAKALWHVGRYEALLPVLRRLIEINPYEPGYHSLMGIVYQSLGRCGAAIRSFVRCAEGSGQEGDMAREQISALQEWETGLVSDLLVSDIVFRAQYARDPAEACRQRGFEFHYSESTDNWLPDRAVVAISVRPS